MENKQKPVERETRQLIQTYNVLLKSQIYAYFAKTQRDHFVGRAFKTLEKEKQIYIFKKQLEIAKKINLPVIIHSRDAAQECFDIIKESRVNMGVIHCYSGSVEMAKEYIKIGFYIGIGGVVTYKNARKLVEVAEAIPIEKIVLETDCPYLAPSPFRGKRNNSSYIEFVAEKIAEIKGISYEKVCEITTENAKKLYDINN